MAKGGGSGPTRGGYFALNFATSNIATSASAAGSIIGVWTVPTLENGSAGFVVTDIQASCSFSGSFGATGSTVGKINARVGSTVLLSSDISLASGSAVAGTLTTSTGVRVTSGTSLIATAFCASTIQQPPQAVNVTITGYLESHPTSVSGSFGSANLVTQPGSFGP